MINLDYQNIRSSDKRLFKTFSIKLNAIDAEGDELTFGNSKQ